MIDETRIVREAILIVGEKKQDKEIKIIFSDDNNLKCRWIIENFLEFLNKEKVGYEKKGGKIKIL